MKVARVTIDCPSKNESYHKFNGERGLVIYDEYSLGTNLTVYFVESVIFSMVIPRRFIRMDFISTHFQE